MSVLNLCNYGFAEPASRLKPRMNGGTKGLKWQCSWLPPFCWLL